MKKTFRKSNKCFYIKNFFKDFFKQYKLLLIIFFIVFLITIFTAVLTAIKSARGLSLFNLSDKALKSYLKGNSTLFGLWFSKFINCVFYVALIFLLSCNKYLIIIDFVLLAYYCFIFTINTCVLIIVYGISSVLFAFFIYFILHVIIFALLVMLVCIFNQMNCKKCYFHKNNNAWWVLILILIIITIQSILTPIFSASIIVIS